MFVLTRNPELSKHYYQPLQDSISKGLSELKIILYNNFDEGLSDTFAIKMNYMQSYYPEFVSKFGYQIVSNLIYNCLTVMNDFQITDFDEFKRSDEIINHCFLTTDDKTKLKMLQEDDIRFFYPTFLQTQCILALVGVPRWEGYPNLYDRIRAMRPMPPTIGRFCPHGINEYLYLSKINNWSMGHSSGSHDGIDLIWYFQYDCSTVYPLFNPKSTLFLVRQQQQI